MYMDLDKPKGFTNDEMEAEIRAMIRAAMQAEAKAYGLWEGAEQLQNAFINEFIRDRKIKKGDKVRVDFSDGAEVLIFDEVRNGRIYAFYLTKKGKPRSRPARGAWIETPTSTSSKSCAAVAPRAGRVD